MTWGCSTQVSCAVVALAEGRHLGLALRPVGHEVLDDRGAVTRGSADGLAPVSTVAPPRPTASRSASAKRTARSRRRIGLTEARGAPATGGVTAVSPAVPGAPDQRSHGQADDHDDDQRHKAAAPAAAARVFAALHALATLPRSPLVRKEIAHPLSARTIVGRRARLRRSTISKVHAPRRHAHAWRPVRRVRAGARAGQGGACTGGSGTRPANGCRGPPPFRRSGRAGSRRPACRRCRPTAGGAAVRAGRRHPGSPRRCRTARS